MMFICLLCLNRYYQYKLIVNNNMLKRNYTPVIKSMSNINIHKNVNLILDLNIESEFKMYQNGINNALNFILSQIATYKTCV